MKYLLPVDLYVATYFASFPIVLALGHMSSRRTGKHFIILHFGDFASLYDSAGVSIRTIR